MKCDKFECCYIIDCTIVDYYITYFGTHTYSHVDFYMYLYFCTIIIYEMITTTKFYFARHLKISSEAGKKKIASFNG